MPFFLSPRVDIIERDQTANLVEISQSKGCHVGLSTWGAVNKPTLITKGETEYVEKFGKPDDSTAISFFIGADYLKYASSMMFVRVVGENARNSIPMMTQPIQCVPTDSAFSLPVNFSTIYYPSSQNIMGVYLGQGGTPNFYVDFSTVTTIEEFFDFLIAQGAPLAYEPSNYPGYVVFKVVGQDNAGGQGSEAITEYLADPTASGGHLTGQVGTNAESVFVLANAFEGGVIYVTNCNAGDPPPEL